MDETGEHLVLVGRDETHGPGFRQEHLVDELDVGERGFLEVPGLRGLRRGYTCSVPDPGGSNPALSRTRRSAALAGQRTSGERGNLAVPTR